MTSADCAECQTVNMLPWVEKYRPKTISEVSHQINPVSALNQIVKTLNVSKIVM